MNVKQTIISILIHAMAITGLFAQEPLNYTVKNGLPTNHIYDAQEDKDGFMWFATNRGLVKFNGKNFKLFTIKEGLPSNDVWELYLDGKKRLWVFSKGKLQSQVINDSIYNFSTRDGKTIDPKPVYEIDNTLYLRAGYYKFTSSSFEVQPDYAEFYKEGSSRLQEKFRLNKAYNTIIYDFIAKQNIVIQKGEVWFLDKTGNVLKSIKNKYIFPGLKNFSRFNDHLIFTDKKGITFINLTTQSLKHIAFKDLNIAVDESGVFGKRVLANNQYQISLPNYLLIFNTNFELLEKHDFPKHLEINHAYKDSRGNIWAYGFKRGVFLYTAAQLQSTYYLKGKKTTVLGQAKDLFLTASETDLEYKFVPEKNDFVPINIAPERYTPYKIFTHQNKGYIVFLGGVYQYDGNAFKGIPYIDFSDYTVFGGGKDFLIKKDTTFLVNGLAISIVASDYKKKIDHQGLLEIEDFNDNVYVGGSDGLFQLKNVSLLRPHLTDTLLSMPIVELKATPKNLWVGTDGRGVYSYSNSGVQHIKETDDLSIQTIIPVADTLWLATNKGVKKVVLKNPISKSVITNSFYDSDGLPQRNVNDIFLRDGQIFAATDDGISKIDPNSAIYKTAPQLYFVNVSDTLTINKNDNRTIEISFNCLNYGNQEHLIYKYRLLPQQKNWVATQTQVLNFSNLIPGNYIIEVSANDQHNNTTQKQLHIIVLAQWWETIVAKILFLISGIGLLILLTRYIVKYYKTKERKQQEAVQKIKKLELQALRSQMNPHFVHNSLNAIQYYIQRHEVELSENYLSSFSKLIRLFFEYSRRQSITVAEEIGLLENYLQIEKLRFEDKITYQIMVDERLDTEEQRIPTMILQPIVENAVNHGLFHKKENGTILIHFKYVSKNSYQVTVEDDGIGIIKSKKLFKRSAKNYQSNSSTVLEERLKLLKESKEWGIDFNIADRSTLNADTTGTIVTLIIAQQTPSP